LTSKIRYYSDRLLVEGHYSRPVRIVAFNTAEGWSRDVTVDIADELRRRYVEFGEVANSVLEFMEAGADVPARAPSVDRPFGWDLEEMPPRPRIIPVRNVSAASALRNRGDRHHDHH
jgi:hypothetical protein